MISGPVTPFSSETPTVPGPNSGAAARAAASAWESLTANKTTAAAPRGAPAPAEARGVGGGVEPDRVAAVRALDPQAVLPDRGEVRAAREGDDVLPGLREEA